MNFIKWYFRNTFLHILVLTGGIVYMSTWSSGLDKNVGLIMFGLTLTILTIGKYKYWKKIKF